MKRLVFRLAADRNVDPILQLSTWPSASTPTPSYRAAPFDTPCEIALTMQGPRLIADLTYALGADEPTVEERLSDAVIARVGEVSRRIMRLEIQREHLEATLAACAEVLRSKELELATKAQRGAPLRMAAHYGLLSSAMNNLLAQEMLPRLRSITER